MKRPARVAAAGAILIVGGVATGLFLTMLGMLQTFSAVVTTGAVQAEQVAEEVGDCLMATAIGEAISLVGLCLLVGGLIGHFVGKKQRSPEPISSQPA